MKTINTFKCFISTSRYENYKTFECSRYPGVPCRLCSVQNGVLWKGTRGPSPITRNRFWRVSNTCTTRKLFIETSKVFYPLFVNRCTNGKFIKNDVLFVKKNFNPLMIFLVMSASGICCAKYAQCNMLFKFNLHNLGFCSWQFLFIKWTF